MLRDVPAGTGYAEILGGYDSTLGGYARGEVGVHILKPVSLFGFAQESSRSGFTAGAGARVTFNLF